jgi:hypothetical protein
MWWGSRQLVAAPSADAALELQRNNNLIAMHSLHGEIHTAAKVIAKFIQKHG